MKKILTRKRATIFLLILLVVIYLLPYQAYYHGMGGFYTVEERNYWGEQQKQGAVFDPVKTKTIDYHGKQYDVTFYRNVFHGNYYEAANLYDIYKDTSNNQFTINRHTGTVVGFAPSYDKVSEAKKPELVNPKEYAIKEAKSYLLKQVGPINMLLYRLEPLRETVVTEKVKGLPYSHTVYTVVMRKYLLGARTPFEEIEVKVTSAGSVISTVHYDRNEYDFSIINGFELQRAKWAALRKAKRMYPDASDYNVGSVRVMKTPDDGLILNMSVKNIYPNNPNMNHPGHDYASTVSVELRPKTIALSVVVTGILLLWMPSILASMFRRIGTSKKKQSTE